MFKMSKREGGRSMVEVLMVISLIMVMSTVVFRHFADAGEKRKEMEFAAQVENIVKEINVRFAGRNFPTGADWGAAVTVMLRDNTQFLTTPWGGGTPSSGTCSNPKCNIVPSTGMEGDRQYLILSIHGLTLGKCNWIVEYMHDRIARDTAGKEVTIGSTTKSECKDTGGKPVATLIFSKQ